MHSTFNGAPICGEPFNFRGGDDQDYIASLFHALERDGSARGILVDDLYHISDEVLAIFKVAQSFSPDDLLEGPRVGQAHRLWQLSPVDHYQTIANWLGHELLACGSDDPKTLDQFIWSTIPPEQVN